MKVFIDFKGRAVRLTDERLVHFYKRVRNAGLFDHLEETIPNPDFVIQSSSDYEAAILYRFCRGTRAGDKFLCVVVKYMLPDAYILTAYPSDQVKKGTLLWERKKK